MKSRSLRRFAAKEARFIRFVTFPLQDSRGKLVAILQTINSDKKRSEKRGKIKGWIQLQTTGSRQRRVAILSFLT